MKKIHFNKKQLLAHLKQEVYCRIMPSPVSGVGIFAIKDIPANIDPFLEEGEDKNWIPFEEKELSEIHPDVFKMIKDLLVFAEGFWWIPEQGMHTLSITQFLNHSDNPNIETDKDAEIFLTKKEIKAGEELTIDYRIFDEAENRF
jgi:hypothetical protein